MPPDLEFVIFTLKHYEDYQLALDRFEEQTGIRVRMHLVNERAMHSRLQSALMSGTRLPDLVEIESSIFASLIRGPLEGIGFHDLTNRLQEEGLLDEFIPSRLAMWSRDGRIFGLPHDIHPVMLAYRADIMEELGIEPSRITTWDCFAEVARREIVADLNGNGVPDRYAIDFSLTGLPELIDILLPQAGVEIVDRNGRPGFNRETTVEVMNWYLEAVQGSERFSFPAGWGQNLAKAMTDGLVVSLLTPDWRTRQLEMDIPRLAGRMRLMPLPAWEAGKSRTSTWGGSALVIPKTAGNPELSWKLAKFLYLEEDFLPDRFRHSNILPPMQSAWDKPFLKEVHPYWKQPIGEKFAALAPDVPALHASPYRDYARRRLSTAFTRLLQFNRRNPEEDPRPFIRKELEAAEADVVQRIERNVFLNPPTESGDGE
ncbi:MAG: extracellular solute-binding protein [Oceanipulchritudo sp.]